MNFSELTPIRSQLSNTTGPFFKDHYATLEVDESVPCIQLTLNGVPRHSDHYRYVHQKRLELMNREMKNFPILHMLTDSRAAGPVLNEDIHHFKNYVLPTMEKAGIRYLAIVVPRGKVTLLTIREMTESARYMTVRYFEFIREARIWLRKMTVV